MIATQKDKMKILNVNWIFYNKRAKSPQLNQVALIPF